MNKWKKLILSLFSLILLLFVFILYGYHYKKQVYVKENNQIKAGTSISMLLETKISSGHYVLSSSCARTTSLGSYSSSTCAGASWLYGKGNEWTISPYSSDGIDVFIAGCFGSLSKDYADFGFGARPVLYLDASVYKIDGEGTLDKPYIIGM